LIGVFTTIRDNQPATFLTKWNSDKNFADFFNRIF
jgi:hypothetical protein